MRPNSGVRLWVFLLLFCLACRSFSQQFIKTDAQGGIFQKDQNLSFSISGPGWFRLLLDDREIYRGSSPAYPELGVPQGEERAFTLSAEYYSTSGELSESLAWHIYIDKKPPSPPAFEFRNTQGGLHPVNTGAEPDAKIRALADVDGTLIFFPDMEDAAALPVDSYPPDSFPALVWAEDLAGNNSDFQFGHFDVSLVKIENPVPGEWLNDQILIITGAEGKSIYWTTDGTHPLEPGGSGRLYRGPERIEKEGRILLRISWREADGRIREDRAIYTVTGNGRTDDKLNLLGRAEEMVINTPVILPLPNGWFWSMGSAPREQPESKTTLRPEPLIKRVAAIHLSPSSGSGIYRYAYLLDEGGKTEERRIAVRQETAIREDLLYPAEERDGFPSLKLVSAGRCRVIVWPRVQGTIFYTWGGIWHEGKGPLPVPLQGGTLRWFMLERESGSDADFVEQYSVHLLSQGSTRERPVGRIALRYSRGSKEATGAGNWEYVSPLLNYSPGLIKTAAPDVCDGEDLIWAFISSGGRILEQQRRNRLSPPAPEITGLPPGGWTRGPVELSVLPDDEDLSCVMEATLRYASGTVEKKSGYGFLEINSALGERVDVTVQAHLLDTFGNRGPVTERYFTLDPVTIYVSSVPFPEPGVSGRAPGAALGVNALGDMYNPFLSLEEALAFAERSGIEHLRIAGNLALTNPVTVTGNLHLESGWTREGSQKTEAALKLGENFYWNIRAGAALTLSGFSMERQRGELPLVRAVRGGRMEISDSDIDNAGPLLAMEAGSCIIAGSRIRLKIPGEKRNAALSVSDTSVEIRDSLLQLEGDYSLMLDLRGGSLFAEECDLIAFGSRTSTLISMNGTRGSLSSLNLEANAQDYASALEAAGAEIFLSGGTAEVSARDSSAVLLERCSAVILDADIGVKGFFSSRAVEITGPFPLVRNCRFFSTATDAADGSIGISSGGRSEVFSGADIPRAGNISGNEFSGFTHIWGPGWPIEKLQAFNQAYASPENPNTLALRP